MAEQSHTPMRWRVDPHSNCDIQSEDGSREIASTHPGVLNGGYCDPSTAQDYARLIAAAPELLEAARLGLETAESWIHDQLDGTSSLEEALAELEPVRAAIAKATGGSV